MKTITSEWVSLGHPDRVCDYISSTLLDECISQDSNTRFAVEVQMKDNSVSLAGEVTTRAKIDWAEVTRNAVRSIGYDAEYAGFWTDESGCALVPNADLLDVKVNIGQQSPDIAQGVDCGGWGDQGIFWGMATTDSSLLYMPADYVIARSIGNTLYNCVRSNDKMKGVLGIDIKTLVCMRKGTVRHIVVAIPCREKGVAEGVVFEVVNDIMKKHSAYFPTSINEIEITVNGTGAYARHGSVGDCGTTGRKLAVDFYGGNCFIGGGSPWTKDGTKADVSLNILARKLAIEAAKLFGRDCFVQLASCIGKTSVSCDVYDAELSLVESKILNAPVGDVLNEIGLNKPVFAGLCRNGLFSLIV